MVGAVLEELERVLEHCESELPDALARIRAAGQRIVQIDLGFEAASPPW